MLYSNDDFETNMGFEAIKIELQNTDDQPERNSTQSIITRERVQKSDFICLAFQFGILEAVLSSNLLQQSGNSNFNEVLNLLNDNIRLISTSFASNPDFYNSLVTKLEYISGNNSEIRNVERLLSTLFQELDIIEREEHMNEDRRSFCIQVFERESSRAKYWLSRIIEETIDFPRYQLLFKKYQETRRLGTSTEGSGVRYVQIQFFPSSSETRDFFLLSFKFFHEYFSHFYTCRFDHPYKIDLKFKEGWLFHTIEDFCLEDLDALLGEGTLDRYVFKSLIHLRDPIYDQIKDYINTNICGLNNPSGEPTELSSGHKLATKFLRFLTQCFSDENDGKMRARRLYYKLSWDLIRHSPSDIFSQGEFIDSLEIRLERAQDKSDKTLLKNDIIKSIRIGEKQQERISIRMMWDILLLERSEDIDELMKNPF